MGLEHGLNGMTEEFVTKKPKKLGHIKAKFWVRCMDCRAIYSDRVYEDYDTCKFCGGANWSDDAVS